MSLRVGDRVTMLRTLTEAESEDRPAQHFCTKGEVLIVRHVTGNSSPINGVWPAYVSREHDISSRSFGVAFDEFSKVVDCEKGGI